MLHFYRRLLEVRRGSKALREGALELLDAPPGVLLFRRWSADDLRVVAVSFTQEPRAIGYESWGVDATSEPQQRSRFSGTLAADTAVILSPPRRAGQPARARTSGTRRARA
jgi:hypothetical protein